MTSASRGASKADGRSISAYGVAWYGLLAIVAVLPLTTSITRGLIGPTYGLTADLYHVPKLLLLAVLGLVVTIAWLFDVFAGGRGVRVHWAHAALLAFAVLGFVSTAFAPQPLSSLFGASGLMTGTVTWATCAWLSFLLSQYIEGMKQIREVSLALVGGCTIVALIALMGAAGVDPLATPYAPQFKFMISQGISTVGNPDFTGVLLLLPTIVAVGLALSAAEPLARWVTAACAVVMSLAIFITLVRGAWLSLVAGLIVLVSLLALRGRISKKQVAVAGAAGVAVVLLGLLLSTRQDVLDRFTILTDSLDALTGGRATLWQDTVAIIARHPLFGTGADRLALGGYEVQRNPLIEGLTRYVLQDPHNLFLLVAGVFGIPALLAFVAMVFLTARSAFRSLSAWKSREGVLLFTAWVAGMTALTVASLISVWTITAMFSLFLGAAVLLAPATRPLRDTAWVRLILATAGVALLAVTLFGAGRSFASSRQLVLAETGDTQARLEAAVRLAPWDTRTRVNYLYRKILAYDPQLKSGDAAQSVAASDQLDTELRLEIARFPRELLLYRLRVILFEQSKGTPGYREEKVRQALTDALSEFPGDPEFTAKLRALDASK